MTERSGGRRGFVAEPEVWVTFLTLLALEIVLGIDNIVFISILVDKLPEQQQALARRLGLGMALIMRILLLLSLSWVIGLTAPLFALFGQEISGRDVLLILGGLFLLGKSTYEIHENLEGEEGHKSARVGANFASVLIQIVLLDLVFSLDSVITAAGMVNEVSVMIAAVTVATVVMLVSAEARTLLQAAEGNRLEALYVLAVTTGMRQGEILGLGWEDVDLESRTVRVRRTLTLAKGGPRLTEPKTKGSRRSNRLTSGAVETLQRHRECQEGERVTAGESWNAWDLVFCTRRGTPIRRDNLHDKHWKPLLRRAELPDIRFHDLRHTCATLLLTKGVHPKIVSEMLGHSSIAITLDTYSHVIPGLGEVAVAAMEDALGDESDVSDVGVQKNR